jgi:S-DNA-T family DNA segregation ATPase FtsK/SpoIIIE
VVVDEYAELIEESPETLEVLTSLGRLGRSLGIHLLLSSQRLDDGRLRGLDAHLRLRVCLRTLNPSDSISVLGSAVAAKLPAAPGVGWLSRDGVLTRIRVALAGAPVSPSVEDGEQQVRVRPICLPPLPESLSLDALTDAAGARPGTARVGLLDLPERGEQRPLMLDLTSADAHLAIIGAPRSGRSTQHVTERAFAARHHRSRQPACRRIRATPRRDGGHLTGARSPRRADRRRDRRRPAANGPFPG